MDVSALVALAGWPAAWGQLDASPGRTCGQIVRRRAGNFFAAFLTLPRARRQALHALYAFCRLADDLADSGRPVDERRQALDALERLLGDALEQPDARCGPVLGALAEAVASYRIRRDDLLAVIDGCRMDLQPARLPDFAALRRYCYHVAAAVGLAAVQIFGHDGDPAVRQHAEALGLAMQLVNILRDVAEDAEMGRVYLPADWLAECGLVAADLLEGDLAALPLGPALARLAAEARAQFLAAEGLLPHLTPGSRACPAALAAIYGALLDRIEADGHASVLRRRPSLTLPTKLRLALGCWLRHR